jgi:hypothetical protein
MLCSVQSGQQTPALDLAAALRQASQAQAQQQGVCSMICVADAQSCMLQQIE